MKRNKYSKIWGMMLSAALIVGGTAACSDDHFDVVVTESASASLWENMVAQSDLSNFVEILENTQVMRTDNDQNATISYAELLSSSQNFSVWAPVNDSYDAKRYLDILKEAKSVKDTDPVRFRELNRDVEVQFVRNHISRTNYEATAAPQTVRLMNDKRCEYTVGDSFNGVKVQGSTIPASNGVLHKLSGLSPFSFNIFDYLAENPEWSAVNEYVHSQDTLLFDESSSIEGTIIDGEMVYVDSVFYTRSPLSSYLGSVSSEDSMYVGVMPTNDAWNKAYEKYKTYYQYGESYDNEFNSETGRFINTGSAAYKVNADSLQEVMTKNSMLSDLFFTATQFSSIDLSDSASIVSTILSADSLQSTGWDYIYNPNAPGRNPYFGAAGNMPTKASNGYVFTVDDLAIDASKSWQNDYNQEGENLGYIYISGGMGLSLSLTEATRNDTITGVVHEESYGRYERRGVGQMYVEFSLPNVLSAKYDIYVVLLPSEINRDYIGALGEGVKENIVLNAEIYMDDDSRTSPTAEVEGLQASSDSVTHLLLFKDFKFEKCYSGLEVSSFPRLRLILPRGTYDTCRALNIDRIYMVPKGND